MIKEIKYTGFSASPSDYECPDGDLAAVLNVVPEEGSLSPVMPPRTLFQLDDGGNVRFVHETSYIKNYIILYPDNTIKWRTEEDPDEYSHGTLGHDFSDRTIYQINAIGNTLIILADDGMHYFLWKGYRNGTESTQPTEYLYLSTHMPELNLSFKLRGTLIESETFNYAPRSRNNDNDGEETFNSGYNQYEDMFDGFGGAFSEELLAKVNKFIKENTEDRGKLLFPFFVRYAYRLFDDTTLTMQSQPILMLCGYPGAGVQCLVNERKMLPTQMLPTLDYAKLTLIGLFHDLYYKVMDYQNIVKLNNWKDIIKSVDIFISKPLVTYDQNGKVGRRNGESYDDAPIIDGDGNININLNDGFDNLLFKKSECINIFSVCDFLYGGKACKKQKLFDVYYSEHDKPNAPAIPTESIPLPIRESKDIKLDIEGCNLFYLLKSIKIDNLKTSFTQIEIAKDYLGTLLTRDVLNDDYDSHDQLISKYSFIYNQRLNIADNKKILFKGYNASSCFCYSGNQPSGLDIIIPGLGTPTPNESLPTEEVSVFYYIRQDEKEMVVHGDAGTFLQGSPYLYLYYPNTNAYRAIVKVVGSDGSAKYYNVPLEKHLKLNGSFYFGGLDTEIANIVNLTTTVPQASTDDNLIINLAGKIYTSELNNPFFFPVLGINTIGTGNVYAISAAAKALSEGQFGQFPLYAFSDEGVWALEVEKRQDALGRNEIGLYQARQPITRDVCINPESITQLDSSVLFATDRGIMLLSGSTSMCISDNLNYDQVFDIESLASSDSIITLAGLDKESFSYAAFREFLLGCRMLYDYVHQRIIVYSRHLDGDGKPESPYPYAYVYSLKTKTWGMIPSNIKDTVPSYPESLAMLFDGFLADYSADGSITGIKGMLITRPLKLDAPDALKTVSTVIQRGNFRRGHVSSVLWGSRDLFHWQLVWSSTTHTMSGFRGTPFKYFRIGVLLDLKQDESLYGCSIEYTPRFTNRLR